MPVAVGARAAAMRGRAGGVRGRAGDVVRTILHAVARIAEAAVRTPVAGTVNRRRRRQWRRRWRRRWRKLVAGGSRPPDLAVADPTAAASAVPTRNAIARIHRARLG